MTELEKAARRALEASTKAVTAMRGIYGGWRCESAIKACEDAITTLTQALATTEPDIDVRTILLDIVPGDGSGLEIYAKNVGEVVEKMTKLHERIEGLEAQLAATTERKGEPVAYREKITGRLCAPEDTHRRKFPMCYEPLYTSPQVPGDVIAILDECRTALIECDRDCDYELIDRAYAALDAARKQS